MEPLTKLISYQSQSRFTETDSLRAAQLVMLELLKTVDAICKKHRISSSQPNFLTTGIEVTLGYHSFPYKEVFPLGKVRFEGYEFSAPGQTDAYLRRMFGDYMTLPPVDKRISHADLILPTQKCEHPMAMDLKQNA